MWPVGSDYPLTLHGNAVWELLSNCGACIAWDGSINGGKLIALVGLFMPGAAQWWLSTVLNLGRAVRLWSALIAVVSATAAGISTGGARVLQGRRAGAGPAGMTIYESDVAARLHHRLFSLAYRLHEAELGFFANLPGILRRLHPGWPATAVGFDVGAGLGPYAAAMRRYCDPLVLIEPNRRQAAYLRRVFPNGPAVVEAAMSDSAGTAMLVDEGRAGSWRRPLARLDTGDAGGWAWSQAVSVDSLDAVAARLGILPRRRALVIKIDVEGHELHVLKGASRLLDGPPALVMVEIVRQMNPESEAVFEFFADRGFSASCFKGGRLEPATHDKVLAMAGRPHGRFTRLSGLVNNFIFIRSGG